MEEFVLLACIEFTDETMTVQPLHVGSKTDCIKVQSLIPVVAYDGTKTPDKSYTVIRSVDEWTKIQDRFIPVTE